MNEGPRSGNGSGERILVVRLGAIGDALRVLPAVRRLRRARPNATIGWAVENWVHPLLAGNPNVDCFHVLDRSRLRGGRRAALSEALRFRHEIRRAGYDTTLDFHARFKSGLVSFFSGAPRRIGFARRHATEGNHLFNNEHVDLPEEPLNRVLRFLHLLRPLGIEPVFDRQDTGIVIPPSQIERARSWYDAAGRPPLAIYPGTSRTQAAYHRWPAERWVELVKRLHGEGTRIVLFWGPDDADYARDIARRAGGACELAPATTLTEMLALLGCFRTFLGSNTAAMHMAWLQGVPTAVFTGPADPRVDAPLPPVPARILRAGHESRPGVSKRHQPDVVAAVPVDEVLRAVRELLA